MWPSVGFLFRLFGERLRGFYNGDPAAGWLRVQDGQIQRRQQKQYLEIRDRAYAAAVNPSIGLAYLHFPVPHMLPIYNRRAGNFDLQAGLDYLDNLALVFGLLTIVQALPL